MEKKQSLLKELTTLYTLALSKGQTSTALKILQWKEELTAPKNNTTKKISISALSLEELEALQQELESLTHTNF